MRASGIAQQPARVLKLSLHAIKVPPVNGAQVIDTVDHRRGPVVSVDVRLGIIATGNQSPFIKNHFNGYLFKNYKSKKIANCISALSKNK